MATARQALRQRREDLDMSQERAAQLAGVSTSTWRSWEDGSSTPRVGRRRRLTEVLDWSAAQVALAFDGNGATASPNGNGIAAPSWLTIHARLEQGAARLWTFQSYTVFALLQTAAYAEAVERADATPRSDAGIARRVELRLSRQAVLDRQPDPLHLSVVLDESVLRRVTGGPQVMAGQLDHLADVAERPNVDLRVLPLYAGQHSAGWGSFVAFASEGAIAEVVCVEDRTGPRYLERGNEVEPHVRVFDHLQAAALSPVASIDAIRPLAKEYR
jgi:DNA-binding XRE family transcriptional regulator